MLLRPPLQFNPDRFLSRGLFTPTDLGAALVAWWSADDHGTANMTDDGAGLISAWVDRIGGLSVTAATTARPTWSATAFTGSDGTTKAGLIGDGVANTLATTTLTGLPGTSTAGEIWVVVQPNLAGVVAAATYVAYGAQGGGTNRQVRKGANSMAPSVSDGTTTTGNGGIGAFATSGPHIIRGTWAGTTQTGTVNGVDFAAAGTIGSLNTTMTRMRFFANAATAAATFSNCVIRHVFIPTTLTAAQANNLTAWCAWDSGMVGATTA
jgi:hypothetical protein